MWTGTGVKAVRLAKIVMVILTRVGVSELSYQSAQFIDLIKGAGVQIVKVQVLEGIVPGVVGAGAHLHHPASSATCISSRVEQPAQRPVR
jgi:hypothetical protein